MVGDDEGPSTIYLEAVEVAKIFFSMDDGSVNEDMRSPTRQRRATARAIGHAALMDNPSAIVRSARVDAHAFLALRYVLANAIAHGKEIPPEARDWLVRFLEGDAVEPIKKEGKPRNPKKNMLIFMAVESAAGVGLPVYSSTPGRKTCAIEAVADALAQLDLQPTSYDGVRRIFQTVKNSQNEDGHFVLDN